MQLQPLTARDKVILVALVIFIMATATIVWGIVPLAETIRSTNAFLKETESRIAEMEKNVADLPFNRKENERLTKELSEISLGEFDVLTSPQVDKWITGIILEKKLECRSLSLDIASKPEKINPYLQKASNEAPLFLVYDIKLTAVGGSSEIMELIDTFINDYPSLKVMKYNINYYPTYETLTMVLKLYMHE